MRKLLLLCALAGCDPVWHIDTVATAQPTTRTEAACVEAGLHATGYYVRRNEQIKAPHYWYVGGAPQAVTVSWDQRTPTKLELHAGGMGTGPQRGAPEHYRKVRDAIVASVSETCGSYDLGPEDCARTPCKPAP